MGFFSDIRVAIDLANAADAINDCFLRGMMPYLNKYSPGQSYSPQDSAYLRTGVEFIERKIDFMHERMNDLPANKWMTTMVKCADGHATAVPGYVMAMKDLCREVRRGF